MFRRSKTIYFALEGLNAFATAFYFYYLFFYTKKFFGFSDAANLAVTALHGIVYIFASIQGGRHAERRGGTAALRVGFGTMAAMLALGGAIPWLLGFSTLAICLEFVVLIVWTVGMCFTWPALEAIITGGEARRDVPHMVGIYNVVWSSCAALAYFSGGALLETLGWSTLFWLPAGIHLLQFAMVFTARGSSESPLANVETSPVAAQSNMRHPRNKTFLRLAWTANPLAYFSSYAMLPLIPKLAAELHLSPMYAGFVCSTWFFARLAAFVLFWNWTGWHYKFRWLAAAYLSLIGSYATILLVPQLAVLVVAQIFFGLAIGLIYYSSLYYSMDAGDTKGEHGGIHEAMIGAGIFAGPATGAVTAALIPHAANGGTYAVSGCLVAGFAALLWLRRRD